MTEFLTASELADYLNCSVSLIRKLIKADKIPYIKIGTSIRFDKASVLEHLKEETKK